MRSETDRRSRLSGSFLFAGWMVVLLAASPILHFASDPGFRRAAIGAIGFISAALGTIGLLHNKYVEAAIVVLLGAIVVVSMVLVHREISARRRSNADRAVNPL